MLKFIICEDNEKIRKSISSIIFKVMIKNNDEYKVHSFSEYNKDFKNIISERKNSKIYILDIELPNISGIEIAREIRKKDWESTIIFLTAHSELKQEAFGSRLLIFSFISKFNNYKKQLEKDIVKFLKISNFKKTLCFTSNYITYRISLDEILYILKDKNKRKNIVITFDKKYEISSSLGEIETKLDERFFRTHQSSIANVAHIKNIDYKNEIITFKNGEKLEYISKSKKKELKDYVELYS